MAIAVQLDAGGLVDFQKPNAGQRALGLDDHVVATGQQFHHAIALSYHAIHR